MLVSSSKLLVNESKGFDFEIELITPGLHSEGYLFCVVCELLQGARALPYVPPKGSGSEFPLS